MRICILAPSYRDSSSPILAHDLPRDPRPFLAEHDCDLVLLDKASAVRQVIALAREGYDVFFNLCDGAWDEDVPGIEVVQALERLNLPFTGAAADFYEPSREKMKRVCHYWGIETPGHVLVASSDDVSRAADTLRFPLIVKHPNSYNSIGLTRASRVEDADALRVRVDEMVSVYGGALIEEFIEGREFTVLVSENAADPDSPHVYAPIEFGFPAGESFKHFALKWADHAQLRALPCADPELAGRLRAIAARFFVAMGGSGYGRCDLRMGADGVLYMLEINPNCSVFYPETAPGSADAILQQDTAGHAGFVAAILAAAPRRCQAPRPWRLERCPRAGYGLVATRGLPAGALIVQYEQTPHVLVSRAHVEQAWSGQEKRWFHTYAYPVSDDVFVTWSRSPEGWRPINHSCEPSAWLSGLDLVARRPIRCGEAITVDYATFCNEQMPPFDCGCGSLACRGVVSGADLLLASLERYRGHFSPYVRARRAAAGISPRAGSPAPLPADRSAQPGRR